MDAGAARIDITPDRPICMAGYSARTAHSEGIYHSLYAKALVVEENGVRGVVLTTDLIGFDDFTCEAVKTGIGEALGLRPENILLTASHTHTGPEMRLGSHKYVDEFDEEYARALVDKLVAVAAQAADELEPVTVRFGTVSCTLGVNRRLPTPEGIAMRPNPGSKSDPVAGVLSFDRSEGDPVAIVMHYACHPTTLGGYRIGADYPGYAQDYVEEAFPESLALFIQGCGGDQKVRHVDGKGFFRSGPHDAARSLGEELGRAALVALGGAMRPVSGGLKMQLSAVELPFQGPPPREQAIEMAASQDRFLAAWGTAMLEMLDTGAEFPSGRMFAIQTLEIGDFACIALAGEMCVGYALQLKELLKPRPVLVAGYANGMVGYVPTADMLSEGGYEAGRSHCYHMRPSPYADESEDIIRNTVLQLLGT